jgi:hypothetical protein
MSFKPAHNCVTTFANGIHPLQIGNPLANIEPRHIPGPTPARDNMLSYLKRNPFENAYSIARHMKISKSNCVDHLTKLINAKLARRELGINPANGIKTYYYAAI